MSPPWVSGHPSISFTMHHRSLARVDLTDRDGCLSPLPALFDECTIEVEGDLAFGGSIMTLRRREAAADRGGALGGRRGPYARSGRLFGAHGSDDVQRHSAGGDDPHECGCRGESPELLWGDARGRNGFGGARRRSGSRSKRVTKSWIGSASSRISRGGLIPTRCSFSSRSAFPRRLAI